jgi:hypothetical protein
MFFTDLKIKQMNTDNLDRMTDEIKPKQILQYKINGRRDRGSEHVVSKGV